nr:hypothetical protein [Spiroplasma sp. Moj]
MNNFGFINKKTILVNGLIYYSYSISEFFSKTPIFLYGLNNIINLKHEIFNNSKKTFTELEQEKVESKKPENFKEHFYFFLNF